MSQPQPLLQQWHQDRLSHEVILLSDEHQCVVDRVIRSHCDLRGWKLWAVSTRSNHVHVVVTAPDIEITRVRDQLKANGTRAVREIDRRFIGRPVWTTKGDIQVLRTETALEQALVYVEEAQDRMDRGK
ncbi:transposase [Stieleria sp. JC731]|uniref:transposase n=1 Tax=Pirellulaceae TaxID=2691357 RepID=UPI001E361F30|nr:transposase [Stieleria sp. JC731]MCC9599960.1 transposase [Stieleria sp. JC731]